jgi:hypothetical protein
LYYENKNEKLAEFMAVSHCTNSTKSNNPNVNNLLLKIIIYYVKYMDEESYLRPQEEYWGVIGSRIYHWFAVDGCYSINFPTTKLIDYE